MMILVSSSLPLDRKFGGEYYASAFTFTLFVFCGSNPFHTKGGGVWMQ